MPQKIYTLLTGLPFWVSLLPGPVSAALQTLVIALSKYIDYMKELTSGDVTSCYTYRLFPQISRQIPDWAAHFQKLEDFHSRARSGQLPAFSYIEPFWSIAHTTNNDPTYQALFSVLGNDYHPPANVLVGEQFVKEVYTSLISNRDAWRKTLLLITFDEFVGTFDHVTDRLKVDDNNPVVQPPWGQHGQAPPFSPTNSTHYGFDSLGARVPTILVSPYVQQGTVFRSSTVPDDPSTAPYDHTSVIATTLKWIGQSGQQVASFGARAAAAPTFDQVLTLGQPRTDEAALPFLDTPRAIGDPVHYGDSFLLKNQNGEYLSSFYCTLKAGAGQVGSLAVDLSIGAYFPTLGGSQQAVFSFVTHSPDPPDQISNNAQVMIVSREPGLSNYNMLGAWDDSHDCYYYSEYFYGDNAAKETWVLQKRANTDQPLRYGDQVYLVNSYHANQRLTRDTRWLIGSGWITTDAGGDYWTVEPAPARVSAGTTQPWNGAPPLRLVAASQQGGSRGAQLWGVDGSGTLRSTFQETPGGSWSGWSDVWNGASPGQLISVTAAQQNDGTVRIWVLDVNNALYSNAQTPPGGNWTGWSPAGWNGAPPLGLVAASQQGGSRGAQLWGVDGSGTLRSTFQETPGGSWSGWSDVWNGASPGQLISVTAAQQNDGTVRIWVLDVNNALYSNAQTSPGGNWTGWSTWTAAPPLRKVAASQQGGPRGAQLWGVDTTGTLRSTYQISPGGQWSDWSGVWNDASPGQLISVTAAQQNDGTVRIWVLDTNNALYSNAQTSPGGGWIGWSPSSW